MRQTKKKYISKEMAMLAALTYEHYLLSQNIDAMLYWHAGCRTYNIVVEYVTKPAKEILKNVECSDYGEDKDLDSVKKSISFRYKY